MFQAELSGSLLIGNTALLQNSKVQVLQLRTGSFEGNARQIGPLHEVIATPFLM